MRMMARIAAWAAAIVALSAVNAAAAPVTINLATGTPGAQLSYIYSIAPDLSLTVTANTFTNGGEVGIGTALPGDHLVTRTSDGLGVRNPGETASTDADQVDGANGSQGNSRHVNDILIFTFSRQITLLGIAFTLFDEDDDFTFFDSGLDDLFKTPIPGGGSYSFLVAATLDRFGVGAIDPIDPNTAADDFRVSQIRIDYADVPLPASIPLFLSALFAAGVMVRRRKVLQ